MAQENRPFQFNDIPEFAMKPARFTEEDQFDPSVYERLFYDLPALEPVEEPVSFVRAEAEPLFHQPQAKTEEADSLSPQSERASQPLIETEPEKAEEKEPLSQEEQQIEAKEKTESEFKSEPATEPEQEAEEAEAQAEAAEPAVEEAQDLKTDSSSEHENRESSQPPVWGSFAEEPAEDKKQTNGAKEPGKPTGSPAGGGARVIPIPGSVHNSRLKLTDIQHKPVYRIFIEEDILVPDVKPDLAEILSVSGKVKLSEPSVTVGSDRIMSLRVAGDLAVQTLYIPQKPEENQRIINIDSRIAFKEDVDLKADPYSGVQLSPTLEAVEYSVINERKFRIKATVALRMREYHPIDVEVFDHIQDEGVQLLKEKIQLTDVACRKTEAIELEEELLLKEPVSEIGRILAHDVSVVENHKQIGKDKAVINALVYCNIMYLSGPDTEEEKALPVIYQGKTEFTQFIKLADNDKDGEGLSGSRVAFSVNSASVSPKTDESGQTTGFQLNMTVDTSLEVYKTREKEIVTDLYHQEKEMQYDSQEISLMRLCGSGMSEVSAREVINVPEKYKGIDRIAFISGNAGQTKSTIEAGKCVVEGVVDLALICIGSDEEKTAFSLSQELPFRTAIEIPGLKSGMTADYEIQLKELWFDKMNNRQIEVNAGILVGTSAMSTEKYRLIQSVSFVESPADTEEQPGMVLYITGKQDDLWSIAKKYRTTIDTIQKINHIEQSGKLAPGTKLLIVK